MQYKISFILLVFFCSFSGFLISIFNNKIINKVINENNSKINDKSNNKNKAKNNTEEDKDEKIKNKSIDNNELNNNEEDKKTIDRDEQNEKNKYFDGNDFLIEEEEEEDEEIPKKEINKNKDPKKNVIYLSLSIDFKYFYPCIVFLTSLLENRGDSTFYHIYILISKSIQSHHISKINTFIEKYGKENLEIEYIKIDDDFNNAVTSSHISISAYYRIALPSLLPSLDKIIYTDVDVINFVDLTEMYNLELKDNIYYKGILDRFELTYELRPFGIITEKYMNSGIVLMNLKSQRKDNVEVRTRKFITHHYLDHHDQTAINAVCYNNFDILSIKYATFNFNSYKDFVNFNNEQNKRYRYSEAELKQAFNEPTLLHYAGWNKPWDYTLNLKNQEYWWYYAKKSDFYNEILEFYDAPYEEIEKILTKIPTNGGLLRKK